MASRPLDTRKYTVGWLCALPIELAAAQLLLDKTHGDLPYDPNDDTQYTLGSIRNHNIVIGCLSAGHLGTSSAATITTRMRAKFPNLRLGLMVGIGGGVPGNKDVRLGDVVVSQPSAGHGGVVQYDFGKSVPAGFVRTGFLNAPPQSLLQALVNLQARHLCGDNNITTYLTLIESKPTFRRPTSESDILFKPTYNHIERENTCRKCSASETIYREPREHNHVVVHYGTIASGNRVIKNATERDLISSEFGGVLCFEMEAAGLMNNWPCLVIRGICDYADSHKNKEWQPYAAGVAAAFVKELLVGIPPAAVNKTPTVNERMLRSAIDGLNLYQFLPMLSAVNQERHVSSIPPLDHGHPMFHWIFMNMDFRQWSDADYSRVLWLSGPSQCNIHHVSSYIVNQEKKRASETDHWILYFFCSTAIMETSIITSFVHTLLIQIVRSSPTDKRILIIRSFLHRLLVGIFRKEAAPDWGFTEEDSPDTTIQKILDAPASELFAALWTALDDEKERELSVVIDGLDKVEHQRREFTERVRAFVERLQQRTLKVKVLVTSRPLAEIKSLLDGLPCIEHDKERKECLDSLHFDNTRYDRIEDEHKGTFEWLWAHDEYKKWSKQNASRLLYIKGKPGSGKSTITKYFSAHLLEREVGAKSATVAKFFYSYRDGELQRSHYNMLRSILYDILEQDEAFFYHLFQMEYRSYLASLRNHDPGNVVDRHYQSLKRVLSSLHNHSHSQAKRLYIIVDGVDESDERDRYDILDRLFQLCSETKYIIIKIFVASRPVVDLDVHRSRGHAFILLEEETRSDISNYARSFLRHLNFTELLAQAIDYIVKNAQGVFIWVKLVGMELLRSTLSGCSEERIFEFLRGLPTDLEDFYTDMFEKMSTKDSDLGDGIKMFRFVFFARRPFTVDELLHALGIPDYPGIKFTPSDDCFKKRVPSEQRIISCGGNFLETKPYHGNGTVQVIHQTVREFFLRPAKCVADTEFRMCEKNAHVYISITCIRYLMLCAANTTLAERPQDWTPKHFERCAQYLEERPLASYALRYLEHHKDSSLQDRDVQHITSQFIRGLTHKPAVYLLESWGASYWKKALSRNEKCAASEFRNKILHTAARNGFRTAAEILLTVGADINAKDQERRAPLSWGAWSGCEAVVRLLVDWPNVETNVRDKYGRTPLSLAAENGHEAVVRMLAERPDVSADPRDENGRTPLSLAADKGHEAVVGLLAERPDVDANSKDEYSRTPLSLAVEKGHEAVVRLLVERPDVNADSKDSEGRTLLSWAALSGHGEVVKLLAERRDVNADSEDKDGRTPLLWAALSGHEEVVKLLMDRPDVNADSRDKYGRTSLFGAAEKGHEAVVRLLAERPDFNADLRDKYGRTSLFRAAEKGHEAVVRMLAERPDVNADSRDNEGRTPLSGAAEKGYEAVVELLAERPDVNADSKDNKGRTPLLWAALSGHEEVVKLLVERPDVNADSKDNMGRTPLSWARKRGYRVVAGLLACQQGVDADWTRTQRATTVGRRCQEQQGEDPELWLCCWRS